MATTQNIIAPPPKRNLPLSKSRDLHIVFVYNKIDVDEDGNPIKVGNNYSYSPYPVPDGVVKLEIETSTGVISSEADVDGSDIIVHIDHSITDGIPKNRPWRLVITYTNEVDDVLVNGLTTRSDGGR